MAGNAPRFLAHHFPSMKNQTESGKLGMWIFLATEILLFSGLFCLYATYRATHPEIFHLAHKFLSVKLGGLNTVVLIFSSLTMALAVRSTQMNKRNHAALLMVITLVCACIFLGVKFVEYRDKFHHGLLPGCYYEENAQIPSRYGHIFFGIYFLMTGLHGLHVVIGMLAIGWVLTRTLRGHFDQTYHTPVETVGLYWHLVDLIWIYLFPLLYLVG